MDQSTTGALGDWPRGRKSQERRTSEAQTILTRSGQDVGSVQK